MICWLINQQRITDFYNESSTIRCVIQISEIIFFLYYGDFTSEWTNEEIVIFVIQLRGLKMNLKVKIFLINILNCSNFTSVKKFEIKNKSRNFILKNVLISPKNSIWTRVVSDWTLLVSKWTLIFYVHVSSVGVILQSEC